MTALLRLAAHLPLPLLHRAGTVLGWMIYASSPRFRKYLRRHLELAGYSGSALRRSAIVETGKTLLELPAVWLRSHAQSSALVTDVQGWDLVEGALAQG